MTKTTTKPQAADPSALPLERWQEWSRRDDWHNLFVGSDIRVMLGEIGRLRALAALAAQPTPSAVGEADDLRHALDRDRYVAAIVLNNLRQVLRSYDWLRGPSRGSYEYDDQRYQHEFGDALNMFEAALGPLVKMAGDKSLCTTDPDKVAAARVAGREKAAALAAPAPQPLDATLREKVAGADDVVRGIDVARQRLAPLMKYGEDAVWRPAQFAYEVLGNARAALAQPQAIDAGEDDKLQIGDRVCVNADALPASYREDWRDVIAYVVGLKYAEEMPGGVDVTISERWPPTRGGDYVDGFDLNSLVRTPADALSDGGGE